MALARQSKIYLTVFELAQYIYTVTRGFRREDKPTLGKRIEDYVLDLSDYIVEANSDQQRRYAVLGDLIVKYEKLQFVINLAVQMKDISYKQQAHIAQLMDSIGRQATGWRKSAEAMMTPKR